MQPLQLYFSSSGRLRPQPFAFAVLGFYLAALASQALTVPGVIAHGGLWPFTAAQLVLTWVWYALHAKRLRDARHATGTAAGIAVVYALALMLFLILAASFFATSDGRGDDPNTTGALTLLLLVYIVTVLSGHPDFSLVWFIVTGLMVMAALPVIVAVGFSLWAATRPSRFARAA
jgi:uncharacterized membrane protein YhaH (DUF805 family)